MTTLPENVNARFMQSQTNLIPEDNQLITRKEQMTGEIPRHISGDRKIPQQALSNSVRPKGAAQANPLQAHTNTSQGCFQTRD